MGLIGIRIKGAFRASFILKTQNLVRVISYIFVVGAFLAGGGIVFHKIFSYLETIEIIGPMLEKRIISLAFLIFLTMIFLSSIITALSTFFRSREIEYLMALPIPVERIFLAKLFENTFYCSWATIIMAIPLTWAYALAHHYPFAFYPLSLLVFMVFITIPSAAGVIILMILINALGRISRRKLVYLLFVALAVLLIFIFVSKPDVLRVPYTVDIGEINAYVEGLGVENKFLPSDHLVKFLSAPFSAESYRFLLLLLSTAIFSVALSYGIALGLYRRGWNHSFETASSGYKKRFNDKLHQFLLFFKLPYRVATLVVKDVRMFTRLPVQWGQSLIFIILLITYIVSLRRTPLYVKVPFWFAIVSFINLGFAGYIVATLSARFVYPSISLEGKSIGILFATPIRKAEFFKEKLITSFLANWLLAEALIIFSNFSLKSTPLFTLICALIVTIYTATVVSISVGLGALFPDFTETNPSKIAAGGGGLLTAILSLVYIAISTLIISIPTRRFIAMQMYEQSLFPGDFLLYTFLFLLISVLFAFFPLYGGLRKLRRMEA
jgi:ABC-2 type transport system permease protein